MIYHSQKAKQELTLKLLHLRTEAAVKPSKIQAATVRHGHTHGLMDQQIKTTNTPCLCARLTLSLALPSCIEAKQIFFLSFEIDRVRTTSKSKKEGDNVLYRLGPVNSSNLQVQGIENFQLRSLDRVVLWFAMLENCLGMHCRRSQVLGGTDEAWGQTSWIRTMIRTCRCHPSKGERSQRFSDFLHNNARHSVDLTQAATPSFILLSSRQISDCCWKLHLVDEEQGYFWPDDMPRWTENQENLPLNKHMQQQCRGPTKITSSANEGPSSSCSVLDFSWEHSFWRPPGPVNGCTMDHDKTVSRLRQVGVSIPYFVWVSMSRITSLVYGTLCTCELSDSCNCIVEEILTTDFSVESTFSSGGALQKNTEMISVEIKLA